MPRSVVDFRLRPCRKGPKCLSPCKLETRIASFICLGRGGGGGGGDPAPPADNRMDHAQTSPAPQPRGLRRKIEDCCRVKKFGAIDITEVARKRSLSWEVDGGHRQRKQEGGRIS